MRRLVITLIILWIVPITASADEVLFRNGDRLTGTITHAGGGKLHVSGTVAGDIVVDMTEVRTFSTEAAIEMRLDDGTVLKEKTVPGNDGTVRTEPGDVVSSQVVPLDRVAQINPPRETWKGNLTAGGLLTRGNSETETFNLGLEAVRRGEIDRIAFAGGYIFGRQKNNGKRETSADAWFVTGKYDYFVSDRLYPFALVRVEKDRIADLDLRLWPIAGAGYQWLEGPEANFFTELGLGWVFEDFRNQDSAEHFAARLGYHYDRQILPSLGMFHNLEYLPSVEDLGDFNLNADIGARASLTKSMFTELKLEWKHDSKPAEDASRNDQRYILSVGWRFD